MAAVAVEVEIERIARRTRLVECDHSLLAEQRVDQCRFAHIGSAHDGDLDPRSVVAAGCVGCIVGAFRGTEGERDVDQIAHVFAVGRRDRQRLPQRELVKLGGDALGRDPFRLVDREYHRAPGTAKEIGDIAVLDGQAFAAVDQENHCIGLGDRLPGLLGHGVHDAALYLGFEAAGVDHEIGPIGAAAAAEMTIARKAGKIRDQCVARLGQPIEKRRFSDIGTSDENERGKHWWCNKVSSGKA